MELLLGTAFTRNKKHILAQVRLHVANTIWLMLCSAFCDAACCYGLSDWGFLTA
jgi:uncharacterized membrane-anchored protein YjiN (DUF445 family)